MTSPRLFQSGATFLLTSDFGELRLRVIEYEKNELLIAELTSGPFDSGAVVLIFESVARGTRLTVASEIELEKSMQQDESVIAEDLEREYESAYARLKELMVSKAGENSVRPLHSVSGP